MSLKLDDIANYFANSFEAHGETAKGLDWNGDDRQRLSMAQCLGLFRGQKQFSVIDLGCGFGPFYDFLKEHGFDPVYFGYDICAELVEAGQSRFQANDNVSIELGAEPTQDADFAVAGGIFNLRLDTSDEEWKDYILKTLDVLNKRALKGFAFNCLTKYSDADRMRDDLYYTDPCWLFDHCKRHYSRNVALLHDYEAYEFTMIVRK